ncbi:class D sortase [Clostridium akagii]|uniref:class D sortase n=1 Tax=Clostridium akagii TaxID=91623 RepID=UPI001FA6E881|nr:class D sortase [Clostridium akagii]
MRIIAGVLVLIGVLIISYAFAAKYWTMQKQNTMINNYEKQIKNSKNNKKSNVKDSTIDSTDLKDIIKNGTIGILTISKIDLKVAIGEGADLKTLKYAVGHFKGTAMPGQKGNFCLAGHRSYTFGEYFNRLGELKDGDEIQVKTVNGEYKYKVYDIQVVLPSQVQVLNPTTDSTMTLVTCTPIRIATHRLIIKARLE